MTFTRTHLQLRDDVQLLKDHIQYNRHQLEARGIKTDLLTLVSKAEAKLDAHNLFPIDPYNDRLLSAYRYISKAWLKIQAPSISGEELTGAEPDLASREP